MNVYKKNLMNVLYIILRKKIFYQILNECTKYFLGSIDIFKLSFLVGAKTNKRILFIVREIILKMECYVLVIQT